MIPYLDSLFPLAASFDWESLLPIVFFIIYGLVQFFGSKKQTEEEIEDSPDREEAEERARRIREEIQRKISERTDGVFEEAPQQPKPQPPNPRSQSPFPEREASTLRPWQLDRNKRPQTQSNRADAELSSIDPMEKELEEQAKRLRDSQNQRKEALRRAKDIAKKAGTVKSTTAYARTSGDSDLDFIRSIRRPQGARRAFIGSQIFGPPKALQDNNVSTRF